MGDTSDVLPPLDLRWARPKPPPPPVLSKLRDYTRLSVAPAPTSTVLSARRVGGAEAPVRPPDDGPHSARQPLDRSRSADARRPPMPGKSPAASPRLDKMEKMPKVVDCEGFLSVLVENGPSCLEPSVLARLESEAATSRRLVELVRLLRTIAAQQQEASNALGGEPESEEALEMARMAAQVVYLEKKLLRLREKVKRRAKEREAAGHSLAPPPEVDVGSASVDDLAREAAELTALQNLQQQHQLQLLLQEPITPPTKVKPPGKERRPKPGGQERDKDKEKDKGEKAAPAVSPEEKEATDALKKQFVALQAQLRDLDAERAAAEASAQKAGALAEEVEQRLQDMVRAREAERAKLEAEREQLQTTIEQQATKLEEVEALCPSEATAEPEDLTKHIEACQAKVVALNKAIAKEQRRVQKALEIPRVPGSEPVVLPETPEPEEPEEPEAPASPEDGGELEDGELPEDRDREEGEPGEDQGEEGGELEQETGEAKPESEANEVGPEDHCQSPADPGPQDGEAPAPSSRPPSGSDIHGQDLLERTASPGLSQAASDAVEDIGSPGPGSSRPPSCNEHDILQATAIASKEEKDLVAMLQKHKDDAEASLQKLQEKLEEARAAHDREELAKRRNLAAETQRVAQLLAERNAASKAAPQALEDAPPAESAKVAEARQRLEQVAAELAKERELMEAASAKSNQLLEERLKQLREEVDTTKHRQGRKGQDLRSHLILSLRPEAYSRRELLHYLSLTASVPSTAFTVLRESIVADDTPAWALPEAPGKKMKVEEQTANAFVRPLPAPKGGPPLLLVTTEGENEGGGNQVSAQIEEEEVVPSEGALVRVMLEVAGGQASGSSTAYRLVKEVEHGGSLLEDMALVGCCAHHGFSSFSKEAGWVQSEACLFARRPCRISGRNLVLSGYEMRTATSLLIKLVAVDPKTGDDYLLCLNGDDISSLLEDSSATGMDLLQQLTPTLCFLVGADGSPAFVAVQSVTAPPTVLNDGPPPRSRPPMSAYDVQAAAPSSEPTILMVDDEPQPPEAAPTKPPISKMDPRDAIAWIETGTSSSSSSTAAPSEGTDFEDVIFFQDYCFLLTVKINDASGEVRVKLQEAGSCQFIDILLPGRPDPKQLRAFVQSHDFGKSSIFVAVEDVAMPPAVVIRVCRGEVGSQLQGSHPMQQEVYWFSNADDDDGGLCHIRSLGDIEEAPSAVVSALLSKHRARLLDCAAAEPYAGLGARPTLALAALPGYGHEGGKSGAAVSDPNGPQHHLQDAQAALVTSQLLAAAKSLSDRPLLKMGCRIPLPNDFSTLCVVSVWENSEPYQHFVISAYEVGTCNVWDLLVSSLDIFKALELHLGPQASDRRSFAAELVKSCELVENDAGDLELVVGNNAETGWSSGGGVGGPALPPLATTRAECCKLQLLTQDAAKAMLQEEGRYCLLQSPRRFLSRSEDSTPMVVSILDEPEAPEAPFHISNMVVIVEEDPDTDAALCFSMRVNDANLKTAFGEEDLLEPEQRDVLLQRILLSLDLEPVGTGGGERLVLQSQPVISSVGLLRPDSAGTLRPVDVAAATALPTPAGTLLALPDAAHSSPGSTRLPSNALPALPPVEEEDGQELLSLPESHVGCFTVESPASIEGRVLGEKEAKVGNLDLAMVLKADSSGHSHVLIVRCLSNNEEQALAVQIPAEGEPTRAYLEHRKFAQTNVIVSVVHQAVPHEVRAIVFDPITQDEAQLIVASESIMPLVERSTRERLSDATELMAQLGTLNQSGEFRLADHGREILPSDSRRRALQSHIPVVRTKFTPSEAATHGSADTRDLLYSCCRYLLGREAITKARKGESALENVPQLRISLSKKCHSQDFTLTIEQVCEDVDSALPPHFLHIRDKLSSHPLGLFAEVCIIGDLRILVVCLDDGAPRSFRLALLEPVTGWSFQIIVVDEASPAPMRLASAKGLGATSRDERVALPELGPSLPRRELLRLFQRRFGARQGGLSTTPAAPLALAAHVDDPEEAKHQTLLSRSSRVVDGTDVAVLLNVLAEVDDEGPLNLRVVLSQVDSSQETSLPILGEDLDTVLSACGLPSCEDFHGSGSLSIIDDSKDEVSRMVLRCLEVSPTLQMKFLPNKLTSTTDSQGFKLGLPDFTKRPETGDVELDCSEDRLLASTKRLLADDIDDEDKVSGGVAKDIKDGAETEGARDDEQHDFLQPRKLHVEVFDGSDCREALFHSTNLRIRVSVKPSGPSATRDLHEADLEDWLEKAGASHLLNASREADLIDLLLEHAMLSDPYTTTKRPVVLLRDIRKEASSQSRFFAAGLLESAVQPLTVR